MLNSSNIRELSYIVKIDAIEPIVGSDNCEAAVIGGWRVMVRKNTLNTDDFAVYFEIDSKLPETEQFSFLASKHYKVRTQKYTFGGRGLMISQGLIMPFEDFIVKGVKPDWLIAFEKVQNGDWENSDERFLTQILNVTYATEEDNKRKAKSADKYKIMAQRHPKFAKSKFGKFCMRHTITKKLAFLFLGRQCKKNTWPVGVFPGVSKTDQERCENMAWILKDKTPYIVTQKCDGSSGTYILERKPFGQFEFYVCSRNVRMMNQKQECFYGEHNYYWEAANKYKIENKMKKWMKEHKNLTFLCWQGEICAPGIQGNPHHLTETHFYCFHWIDSENGRRDIREADKDWKTMSMEVVPIVDTNYILPDDFEQFKITADGYYNNDVCEGHEDCPREGFVYYKTTEPSFSFKNVSRQYLLKHS